MLKLRLKPPPQEIRSAIRFRNLVHGYDAPLETSGSSYQRAMHELEDACKTPDYRRFLKQRITGADAIETARAFEEAGAYDKAEPKPGLNVDVLYIGSGVTAGTIATRISSKTGRVEADQWMADRRPQRAGPFGEGAEFELNSPREGTKLGMAGELHSPNYTGTDLSLDRVANGHYPTKSEADITFSLMGYLVSKGLTNVEIERIQLTGNPKRPYKVTATHNAWKGEFGQKLSIDIYPKSIVAATGIGDPSWGFDTSEYHTALAMQARKDYIFDGDSFRRKLQEIASPESDGSELLSMLRNGLAIGGAQDSTNIVLEMIIGKLKQMGIREEMWSNFYHIYVYGAKYSDPESFRTTTGTDRYQGLANYVGKYSFIRPVSSKISGLVEDWVGSDRTYVSTEDGRNEGFFGTIACMTGYKNDGLANLLDNIIGPSGEYLNLPIEQIKGSRRLNKVVIGKRVRDQRIYIAGPATEEPLEKTPNVQPRFVASIRRWAPRNIALADKIWTDLKQAA